jgi:hypothetical protein
MRNDLQVWFSEKGRKKHSMTKRHENKTQYIYPQNLSNLFEWIILINER